MPCSTGWATHRCDFRNTESTPFAGIFLHRNELLRRSRDEGFATAYLGLYPWTDGATIDQLLGSESSLMQYEGSWEDLVFLTVALENGNSLGTWWDGSKVDGAPTTWAMDAIVGMLNGRVRDACGRLAAAGAAALSGKRIDTNRVYLIGTSMDGSGAYHIGIRHPEIFAAIHANAGFADYNGGSCGNENFCLAFANDFIGTTQENQPMKGLDGRSCGQGLGRIGMDPDFSSQGRALL